MTTPLIFQEPAVPPAADAPPPPAELDLDTPTPEAPYGWRIDADGRRVPKKTAGRRPKAPAGPELPTDRSPSLEELRASGGREKREDKAPAEPPRQKVTFSRKTPKEHKPAAEVPPFRAGPIAKGINRLYRRAGKIFKIWDPAIGAAIISSTRKDEDDDEDSLTVGEAWEELARVNPRIRAALLTMISGGAWTQLFMAHAPILLAIMMKDSIRRRLPLQKLVNAFLDSRDEEDQGEGVEQMMGGMSPQDLGQMLGMLQGMMPGMMADIPRGMNEARAPEAYPEAV